MEQKQYTVVGSKMQMIFDVTHITSQREQIKNYILLLKQNKKYFSEQIKLDTF